MSNQNLEIQQRTYARIEDLLPFSWRVVDPRERLEIVTYFEKHGIFPPQHGEESQQLLSALDIRDPLKRLEKENPDLAFVLGRLDVKLNLLLQLSHPDTKDRHMTPTRLNLGGGGIAFWANGANFSVGDFLEIRLALSVGSLAIVDFFVQVIDIEMSDRDNLAKIACQFGPILDDVREQIIQHVFKRQTTLLRSKRRVMEQ